MIIFALLATILFNGGASLTELRLFLHEKTEFLSIRASLTETKPQVLVQHFQFLILNNTNPAKPIPNASRIVLTHRHRYDICCFSQPVGSKTQLRFDTHVFEWHINNIRHASSVSSCIRTTPGVSGAGYLSRSNNNGTVFCESSSSGGNEKVTGWFFYDVWVPPKLDCNWTPLASVKIFGEDIRVSCNFSTGWPPAIPQCWLGGLGDEGGINSSRELLPLETKTNPDGHSILSTKLPALRHMNGREVQCSAEQTCPQGSLCINEVLAKVNRSGVIGFKVQSTSSCMFSPRTLTNVTSIACDSTEGVPEAKHSCFLIIDSKEIGLSGNRSLKNTYYSDSTKSQKLLVTEFIAPMATITNASKANASIRCVIQQLGFPDTAFIHEIVIEIDNFTKPIVSQRYCFNELGCFTSSPVQPLPEHPRAIGLRYYLFTRRNSDEHQEIYYRNVSSIRVSEFNWSHPTKMIIHGYLSGGKKEWIADMRKVLLQYGDFNVIQVDWGKGSADIYLVTVANTQVVGAMIAQMIKWLETQFGADREDFHLIGHSLGAHIAGYAGERLAKGSRQLGRITGMDPAGPNFENNHPKFRLDPSDARFVDAIHSNGDSGGYGLMQPVGHVDFYPNGGKKQPGCSKNLFANILSEGLADGTKWTVACHHLRVLQLMTSTIVNFQGDYQAFPCDSYEDFKAGKCMECGSVGCAQMGIRANEWKPNGRTNVKMFLDTSGKDPFATHHYLAKITISSISEAKRQYGDLMFTMQGADGKKSSEVTILSQTYMDPGEVISHMFTNPEPVFDLTQLIVFWKDGWNWLLVFNIQLLHLNRIEIFEGLTQKRSLYCFKDARIVSGKSLTVSKSNSC